ncbi:helix-turn-helix domain-containing protein [Cylindrospermopsis curvispora]|uniref:Helix-turn-helix domain-containing protein n=1 Tax=Cylindrospermopsis curvispora GIHE-G1 TaxID=2666332 RepID=A0A7H0F467_9CYAN|nr:RodZ domain-containing protein [Cylindrospermopsis curvispora]QNP30833.1 helix-turn-helix domain-containing protein [Cylindrospermopsis curvispora GIHE-G1]
MLKITKWLRLPKRAHKPKNLSIEEQQLQKLSELGSQLAALRQEKGLSISEVVSITRIPGRLLTAIEVGDLSSLPEPVYIQGLIRQFANALGLNGVELASNFPTGSPKLVFKPRYGYRTRGFLELRAFHLYLLYIFVIVCSVNGLSQSLTQNIEAKDNDNKPHLQASTDISGRKTPIKIVKVRQLVNLDSNGNDTSNDPLQVHIMVNSQAWIHVVADGKTKFEGVLTQGSQRDWEATEELIVKTNNAGGVVMKVNQEEPKQMGKPGRSGEIRIASKNLQF